MPSVSARRKASTTSGTWPRPSTGWREAAPAGACSCRSGGVALRQVGVVRLSRWTAILAPPAALPEFAATGQAGGAFLGLHKPAAGLSGRAGRSERPTTRPPDRRRAWFGERRAPFAHARPSRGGKQAKGRRDSLAGHPVGSVAFSALRSPKPFISAMPRVIDSDDKPRSVSKRRLMLIPRKIQRTPVCAPASKITPVVAAPAAPSSASTAAAAPSSEVVKVVKFPLHGFFSTFPLSPSRAQALLSIMKRRCNCMEKGQ